MVVSMSAAQVPEDDAPGSTGQSWTIDELAALFGLTVRTTRYYASLGLMPPPQRRGRMAYYDERHRARLELVQTLQEQGMTLAAIESHLRHIAVDTPVAEIELRRALLSGWAPSPPQLISRSQLDERAGRAVSDEEIDLLQQLGTLRRVGEEFEARPTLDVGLGLLDLDISVASMEAATEAIQRHMNALALELREILRSQVLGPIREQASGADPNEFGRTMARLRQLTLEAVVSNFQQAANGLVDGSLLGRDDSATIEGKSR
jgi:DNA-binding transcriptional MerR regulator